MKKIVLGLSLLASLGVMMGGCGDSGSSASGCPTGQVDCDGVCIDEISPTLDGANGIQAAIFTPSCTFTNCHGSMGAQQAGLDLSSVAASEADLIDVDSTQIPSRLRVDAGDSGASYLVNKVLGEDIAPMTQQMPIGFPLCQPRLAAIQQWIDGGAPIE